MIKSYLLALFFVLFALHKINCNDNGFAKLPPMGWRSWNYFHGNVDQKVIESQVDALVDRSRTVNGEKKSLLDLGYNSIGLDDNWQECGAGVNGSFHDKDGNPIINKDRFPDMKAMNDYAHTKGAQTGWYMNNCICGETGKLQPNWPPQMKGDTSAIYNLGWDGVKIDGCGPSHDLMEWSDLLNKTGKAMMIENCHDNTTFPYWNDKQKHDFVVCPMHYWRVSTDIQPDWTRIIGNLQECIPFQDLQYPITHPGCWNYPDMLEVGVHPLTYTESRSHFGAWCVVSSPLILGFDLSNNTVMDSIWDIITNTEALAVSQTWAGHPGRLVKQASSTSLYKGYSIDGNSVRAVGDWQIWGKVLDNGDQAALVLNVADSEMKVGLLISDLGFKSSDKVKVRDIWNHKDLGTMNGSDTINSDLKAHDSAFLRFSLSQ